MRLAPVLLALIACHAHGERRAGPPTCPAVAEHVRALYPTGDEHGPKVRDVLAARCAQDHWSAEVMACLLGEPDLHSKHYCQDQLTAAQRSAFAHDLAQLDAPPPVVPDPQSQLPLACISWGSAVEEFAQCAQIPEDERDAMQKTFLDAAPRLAGLASDQRELLTTACQEKADAVRQQLAQRCPP